MSFYNEDDDNPYPKGSQLAWVFRELRRAERMARHTQEQHERQVADVNQWRRLMDFLVQHQADGAKPPSP